MSELLSLATCSCQLYGHSSTSTREPIVSTRLSWMWLNFIEFVELDRQQCAIVDSDRVNENDHSNRVSFNGGSSSHTALGMGKTEQIGSNTL